MPTNLIKPTNRIEPTSLMQMVQAQNWAIIPEKLDAIHQVLAAHAAGQKIDIEAVKAETGNPMENEYNYQVLDGVAVVPVHGVIAKRMNLMQKISGGVSTEIVGRDIRAALDDPDVRAILLDIDSPGGTVDGTEALAESCSVQGRKAGIGLCKRHDGERRVLDRVRGAADYHQRNRGNRLHRRGDGPLRLFRGGRKGGRETHLHLCRKIQNHGQQRRTAGQ